MYFDIETETSHFTKGRLPGDAVRLQVDVVCVLVAFYERLQSLLHLRDGLRQTSSRCRDTLALRLISRAWRNVVPTFGKRSR